MVESGKKLTNPELWPITLVTIVNGVQVKVQGFYLMKEKVFDVRVNDDEYTRLIYTALNGSED